MNLSRFVRSLLTSALFAAPMAYAAEPVVLHVGDQNYYNVRASVEASGVLDGAPYTVDWKHFQAAAPLAEALNTGRWTWVFWAIQASCSSLQSRRRSS